jgi:hypothetical protein
MLRQHSLGNCMVSLQNRLQQRGCATVIVVESVDCVKPNGWNPQGEMVTRALHNHSNEWLIFNIWNGPYSFYLNQCLVMYVPVNSWANLQFISWANGTIWFLYWNIETHSINHVRIMWVEWTPWLQGVINSTGLHCTHWSETLSYSILGILKYIQ